MHPQPDAPITITRCAADVRFSENRWGTFSSTLNTYVDFRNTSSKSAVAVLFHLQLSNAFGDVLDNIFGQATGQFAPSAVITGNHWSDTDRWAGLGIIECSVARVLFWTIRLGLPRRTRRPRRRRQRPRPVKLRLRDPRDPGIDPMSRPRKPEDARLMSLLVTAVVLLEFMHSIFRRAVCPLQVRRHILAASERRLSQHDTLHYLRGCGAVAGEGVQCSLRFRG